VVISRLPAPEDGSQPKTSSAVAILLVLAVVLGIWLLNGRDPGTGTNGGMATEIAPSAGASSADLPDEDPSRSTGTDPESGLPYVELGDLPEEASDTVALIDRGPPYPYEQDGSTFGNFEGFLPERERGYYEEYTVETPGSRDRGARRIVAGDEGELYWTEDHYDSFEQILR
jgi:ribonuclease T1